MTGPAYRIGTRFRDVGIESCQEKAVEIVEGLILANHYYKCVNIGGGRNMASRWGIIAHADIESDCTLDFNTIELPFENEQFDVVICEQVIEHLHNTTFFISELKRITRKHLILATENLLSVPNKMAMLLNWCPFSLQPLCGHYLGGLKEGTLNQDCGLPVNHPAYSGVTGHVRVLSRNQLRVLLGMAGFTIVRKYSWCLGHFILFHCVKHD